MAGTDMTDTQVAAEAIQVGGHERQTLLDLCWPDGRKFCPRCRTGSPYQLSAGRLRCSGCRYTFHDFTGRWLNLTGLTPGQWMALADAFAAERNTRETAQEVGISYNTAFKALTVLRLAILAQGADARELFGPRAGLAALMQGGRLHNSPEAPPQGGLPIYGILSQAGQLFVDLVPELSVESVLHFNHNFHLRVSRFGNILLTDRYRTYDALILCGDDSLPYHYLLRHSGVTFAESGGCPFWDFAHERLRLFKGLSWQRFPLYLKELALRYNMRGQDVRPTLLHCLCTHVPNFM